jgi:hypothetical protein
LIPRPEIVWPQTPRTYNIWYAGAAQHFVPRPRREPRESCNFWIFGA